MKNREIFFCSLVVSLLLTVFMLVRLIPILKAKKIGQKILDIGPNWHKSKEGTPTMGGISFVFSSIITTAIVILIFRKEFDNSNILMMLNIMFFGVLNALIGLIDDIAKMKKSKNQGLTPMMKFAFQSIVAILFIISLHFSIGLTTVLYIPFFDIYVDIGFLYYVLAYFVICGVVNSVNLTDGIDGLASSVTLTVGIFITVVCFMFDNTLAGMFGGLIIGITIAFLFFNLHPAKIFMGDTGSLFLGAMVVALSFMLDNVLIVLFYGFMFVIEAASDIMQVAFFKLSKGKRLFKMAPLHHHFEKKGWSETRVVTVFMLINLAFCGVALLGLGNL